MTHSIADRWITMVPGIRRRTLVAGAQMMQMVVTLDAGSHLPEHHHPHEQITYVISGRLRMLLAGVAHELAEGQSLHIPGGTPHAADATKAHDKLAANPRVAYVTLFQNRLDELTEEAAKARHPKRIADVLEKVEKFAKDAEGTKPGDRALKLIEELKQRAAAQR